ncbi:MAG: glycosyltransferase [Acidimicrobiales bacterium]
MTRPVLELLAAPGAARHVGHLVRELSRWCDPRAADAGLGEPVARLACSWRAAGIDGARRDRRRPLGLWVDDPGDVGPARAVIADCAVAATAHPVVADRLGEVAVLFPRGAVDPHGHHPLPPFVRARWRRRLGFPAHLVVDLRTTRHLVPAGLVPTALALAGAAVVDGRWLEPALALGTPVVADRRSALGVGATPGQELVVAEGADALPAAESLATDVRRAAALGRAGRRLIERRNDHRSPATEVARRLGIIACADALGIVEGRLDELWTPPLAAVAQRARGAVAPFAGTPAGGGS